jgi:hypothetical protein
MDRLPVNGDDYPARDSGNSSYYELNSLSLSNLGNIEMGNYENLP